MFSYIYEWISNLSCYLVLVTVFSHVVPEGSYQRYIRFFSGMVLVVMLAAPLLDLFSLAEHFRETYENAAYLQELEDIREASRFLEEIENPLWEEGADEKWETDQTWESW